MFLDSFRVITEHWLIFAVFLAAITTLYILELKIPKGKTAISIVNLCVHTALFLYCLIIGAPTEIILLLILAALLAGLLI